MTVKPLKLPELNELPDLNKDLFAGMNSPAGLMSVGVSQTEDLLNPKPLFGQQIKLSNEASKALQQSSAVKNALNTQAEQLYQQQAREQEQLQKNLLRASEQRIKENEKRAEEIRKAQEKARQEKAEEQGGKLGVASDGSFVTTALAQSLLESNSWRGIVSDLERKDQMESWLKSVDRELRNSGVTDETVIKDELDNARKIITADTNAYKAKMKADKWDIADLGRSVVKGVAPISNLVGAVGVDNVLAPVIKPLAAVASGVGKLTGSDGLTQFGKEMAGDGKFFDKINLGLQEFGSDLSNALDEAKSSSLRLDSANNEYLNRKTEELNPNRSWAERAGDFIANIHKSGNKFNTAMDLAGVAIPAVFTGGGAVVATQGLGRAALNAGAKATAGGLRSKALTKAGAVLTENAPAIASTSTVLLYGGGDAAQSAWGGVMNTDFGQLKTNYINNYGQADWDKLSGYHKGNEEAIKRDIADNSAERAVAMFAPMAVLSAPLGLESMVARTVAGRSASVAGSKLLAMGGAAISEGLEEGLTTVAGNLGQQPYTGIAWDAGVPEAGALGAIAGAGLSAPLSLYDGKQGNARNLPISKIAPSSYVTDDKLNYQLFQENIMRSFLAEKHSALRNGMSEPQALAYLQAQYNHFIDNEATWGAMTAENQQEFKELMESEFGITNNRYARYADSAVQRAFASGDINQVKATGDEEALNAFRMINDIEAEQVVEEEKAYYSALGDVMAYMETQPKNVNTKQRHAQYVNYTNGDADFIQRYKNTLSRQQLAELDRYVMNTLDASMRRLTDAEQIKFNQQQGVIDAIRAKTEINQQEAINAGEPRRQSAITEDGGTVADESVGVGGAGSEATQGAGESVGASARAGAGSNNSQSVGVGVVRQEPIAGYQSDVTAGAGADVGGVSERTEQATGAGYENVAGAVEVNSRPVTDKGVTSPAEQAGGPVGQLRPDATQATVSGGSVGVTQAERRADDGSAEANTQLHEELKPEITREDLSALAGRDKRVLNSEKVRRHVESAIGRKPSSADVATYLTNLSDAEAENAIDTIYGKKALRPKGAKELRNVRDSLLKVSQAYKGDGALDERDVAEVEGKEGQVESVQDTSVQDTSPVTGDGVVEAYFKENPQDLEILNTYLREERDRLQKARETEFLSRVKLLGDGEAELAQEALDRAGEYWQQLQELPDNAVDMVNAYLTDGIALQEAVKQAVDATGGTVDRFTFSDLPQVVQDVLAKVWGKVKSTVAAVSLALATTLGATLALPIDAQASTAIEKAVVSNIVQANDHQGKQFIVADKQAGTMTLYSSIGKEITTTPALFGKAFGDSIRVDNATPSGRYETQRVTNIQGNENNQYGKSAQALTVDGALQENNAGNLAIHRVLPTERRQARINSLTAEDNRVSHGCINVPVGWYDTYLENNADTVVYVLPETDAGRTGVFDVDVPASKPTAISSDVAVANVSPAMDKANAESVVVTAEQVADASVRGEITKAPAVAGMPLTIAGSKPSGQVAYVQPVVIGGVSADKINVPFGQVTPAEMQADGVFDTDPVPDGVKTEDGVTIYDVAVALAVVLGGGGYLRRRVNKRKRLGKVGGINQDRAQEVLDANHNEKAKANGVEHVPKNLTAPMQKSVVADAVNRAMWIEYVNGNSHLTAVSDDGFMNVLSNLDLLASAYDEAMSDVTIVQGGDGTFADSRQWKFTNVTDPNRKGISAKVANIMAGATQNFDNLMNSLGVAKAGHEADSSIPSVHLAQVKAKSNGAYTQIHKLFIKPLLRDIQTLAINMRVSTQELEADIGRTATLNHILNEAADAMWAGREKEISLLREKLASINALMQATDGVIPEMAGVQEKAKLLQKEINSLQGELDRMRDMYEGRVNWDGNTPLPGGYTKALAELQLAGIKAKYGDQMVKVDGMAKATANTIHAIRQFATASGVFTQEDLNVFNALNFQEYVPLYKDQQDPFNREETDDYTKASLLDALTEGLTTQQIKSLGLTKDLTRYRRKGARSPSADGITNLKIFALNMAGRIGQQQWLNSVQQLYEGNVGKAFSQIAGMSEEELAEINESPDSGKVPGLIRVRPEQAKYIPRNIRNVIEAGGVRPIIAKGFNQYGELVTYHYYFTEPAIRNEIYQATDLGDTLTNRALRELSTFTRTTARFMTTFKPVWNAYNYFRDSFERISVMLMRPVKDRNGKVVDRWDLTKAYFGNLAKISGSLKAQRQIYRYLVQGEVKSELQRVLHEAVGSGAINIMTAQTEKHSVVVDLRKSKASKLLGRTQRKLASGLNKAGLGKSVQYVETAADFYVMRLTEVPQVTTALASYLAYQEVGVNKTETANRVRDQYDPLRAGKHLTTLSAAFPFIRSTFSGHYNLIRSLTEYWGNSERMFTALYLITGILGVMAVFAGMAGLMGDDEDGVPRMARLPVATLMQGIPVPMGDDGVWSVPVGFGMHKVILGIGANLYKQVNGQQTGSDTATVLAGLLMDNISPVQTSSAKAMQSNPIAGVALTFTPTVIKPLIELGFNVNAFHGGEIISRETPKDQNDYMQDNFNTPEVYKDMATAIFKFSDGFIDVRPESLKYLLDQYGGMAGPLGAVPKSVLQDKADKTLYNQQNKGEHFGPFLTAIGADMAMQPNALDITSHTYAMQGLRYKLHKRYGIGETHDIEEYVSTADKGPRGGMEKLRAWQLTKLKMEKANVPADEVEYVANAMKYRATRKKLDSEFKELANKYYDLRQKGEDSDTMRRDVQKIWDALEKLDSNYVKENNRAYFEIMQRY